MQMQNSQTVNRKQETMQLIAEQLWDKKRLKVTNISEGDGSFHNIIFANDGDNDLTIKVISIFDGIDSFCEELLADAQKEAKILSECEHQHIVRYISEFQIGNNYFIVMEKCEMSLQDWIDQNQNKSIDKQLFIRFALETLKGVDFLHNKGYVLRNLSLNSILLDTNLAIKLCDFGLAKMIDSSMISQALLSSKMNGEMLYLPPEFLEIEKIIQNKEANVWALGICLYALAGAPFKHIMYFISGTENFQFQQHLGTEINDILISILKKEPNERPKVYQIIYQFFELINFDNESETIQKEQKTSGNDLSFLLQGDSFYDKDNIEDAFWCYNKAIELNPNNFDAHFKLGFLYETEQMDDDALSCYKKTNQINPNYFYSHYNLGIIYQRKQMLDDAFRCYSKAIEINPNYPDVHLNIGNLYFKKSMHEDALRCYNKAIEINPDYQEVYINLGKLYGDQSMYEDALRCFNKAIEIDPNNFLVYYQLGNFYYKKSMKEDAISCYNKSIEIHANHSLTHFNLGVIYYNESMYEDALRCYNKAIEIDPNNVEVHNNLGMLYDKITMDKDALRCFYKAIEICPYYYKAYINLGNFYEKKSMIEDAMSCYNKAIKLGPNDSQCYIKLADLYYTQSMFEGAIRYYNKAIEINPKDPFFHYKLGAMYCQKHMIQRALKCFFQAYKINPREDYNEIIQSLKSLI